MSSITRSAPPDQAQRERALAPHRSILVQAPAGSGKTDLLTRRFLRLLAEVEDPSQVVAITFTKAAAAEMRHRILLELEKAAANRTSIAEADEFAMDALALRALQRSEQHGWNLLDLPAQLRISTIDSFCRELALQQPLLSGLGGGLDISEQPHELYRQAARRTLQRLAETSTADPLLLHAIERLLLWRDNNWQEVENQLVLMLSQRDRWMQGFVLDREPDESELRGRLERPFARAVEQALGTLSELLESAPGAIEEVLELARFACDQSGGAMHRELAELAEFPAAPSSSPEQLEQARHVYLCLANFLLTTTGTYRKTVNVTHGFPADRKREKQRMLDLIRNLDTIPLLESALADLRELPPAQFPGDEWQIVRACFTLLRQAAAELQVVFAEAGVVDFTEVSQVAQRLLADSEGFPTDTALAIADGIRHLLVDEFQDTSRRQHQLIRNLAAAWPDTTNRSIFVVGDPMQSIYFFRDADAELFPRVRLAGLELANGESLLLDFVQLASNFRTVPELVATLNTHFENVFAENDGSGIEFSPAQAARANMADAAGCFQVHLEFVPQTPRNLTGDPGALQQKLDCSAARDASLDLQIDEILEILRAHQPNIEAARARGEKYRIAILGRTRTALRPIAAALRNAEIPFLAVDLERLSDRPEVLDALALARALFNAEDRVSWLGVLRAPWCGLSARDLHTLVADDNPELLRRPIPDLLVERLSLLSDEGQVAAHRVMEAAAFASKYRSTYPDAALGTWLEQVWAQLGGGACVTANERANLDLLWSRLDQLPEGEPDLLGRALATALADLTAQPDPAAESDYGVQLMTIHKSKGLEFEVVIVPELQARGGQSRNRMLSWLERGLTAPDDWGDVTEFLVAPQPPKGEDRGSAKAWVDAEIRRREAQEMRRILYVAATRAREALHLFARPTYKSEPSGDVSLCDPSESLLSTAWPALSAEVTAQFEIWKNQPQGSRLDALAASGQPVITMPAPAQPAVLRRLPRDYAPVKPVVGLRSPESGAPEREDHLLYARHEGGLASRALGIAVHTCFEQLAKRHPAVETSVALTTLEPPLIAHSRALGLSASQASAIARQAIAIAQQAAADPIAGWILFPHPDAASETRWTGLIAGELRTVQADRVFRAGLTPQTHGLDAWWIIDYKTAQADSAEGPSELARLRSLFAPQLELYATVLRSLHGKDQPVRAGLYYPRLKILDWWEP